MTNIFNTPILARSPWQLPYPIGDYGRATEEIRELTFEANRTALIFFLDFEGNIRGGLRPTLVRINGVVDHIRGTQRRRPAEGRPAEGRLPSPTDC